MKRIYNNSDIQINLKAINGITDKFIIKFFTTNKEFFIRKTNENVYTVENEKYIKLNWSELQTIGDGVLNYVLNNIKDDSDYDDGEYNNTISKTTNYYICSNFKVDPETDKSISEIIAELTEKVDKEITRSSNKDGEHDTLISDLNNDLEIEETARKDADTQLQNSLVENEFVVSAALNDLKSNKAEKEEINTLQSLINQLQAKIEAEETARQNADTTLQTDLEEDELVISSALNDLKSSKADKEELITVQANLTTEIENETTARQDADTQLQSNINRKANIEDVFDKQTAISTFVTKAELQEILKKINGGEY